MLTYRCPDCGHTVKRRSLAALAMQVRLHLTVSHSGQPVITEKVS